MAKIRVKTAYSERTNTYYHRDFYVTEKNYSVGDFYTNGEEIKKIEEIEPDIESRSIKEDYQLVKILTTFNGEFDIDNDNYCEEYVAIKL